MPFGILGRTGPEMRQVVGFGDRSTGRGTFGGEFSPPGPNGRTYATAPRRGPLAKLLWADLFAYTTGNMCLTGEGMSPQSTGKYFGWFIMPIAQSPLSTSAVNGCAPTPTVFFTRLF